MKPTTKKRSLLGQMIANRLEQLGMSRREFCRRFNISRPTMHDLEYNWDKDFAASTYEAIDKGMKWQAGTAYAFHTGKEDAREQLGIRTEEMIESYLEQIVQRLIIMDVNELEREVLMLEEELYGRPLNTDEASIDIVKATVGNLLRALNRPKEATNNHDA
jgi:transcriptional regulator with XRE-family HTH domain